MRFCRHCGYSDRDVRFGDADELYDLKEQLAALNKGLQDFDERRLRPLREFLRSGKIERVAPGLRAKVQKTLQKLETAYEAGVASRDLWFELKQLVDRKR